MIHAWSVDTISSLGASKGLGSVGYGTMRVVQPDGTIIEKGEDEIQRGDVPAEMPDEPTTFSSEGVSIEEVSLEIGDTEKPEARSHLLVMESAQRILEDVAKDALNEFQKQILKRSGDYLYRKIACGRRAQNRMALFVSIAKVDVLANCYPEAAQKKGVQIVSTSRASESMPLGRFKFNGKPAWRQAPGHPPLPETAWLARYRARRKKQNKTKRVIKNWKKRRRLTKAPALSGNGMKVRPARILNLKANDGKGYRDVLLSRAERLSGSDFFDDRELEPETILAGYQPLDWSNLA